MIIEVTQDDIDYGIPKDGDHCAIARAVRRMIPEADIVSVSHTWVRWQRYGEPATVLSLPQEAREFVSAFGGNFGQRVSVKPFTFEAEAIA